MTLWHHEDANCDITNTDYSLIHLTSGAAGYTLNGNYGSALFQGSTIKFNAWPYENAFHSADEQNELLYFVK